MEANRGQWRPADTNEVQQNAKKLSGFPNLHFFQPTLQQKKEMFAFNGPLDGHHHTKHTDSASETYHKKAATTVLWWM